MELLLIKASIDFVIQMKILNLGKGYILAKNGFVLKYPQSIYQFSFGRCKFA